MSKKATPEFLLVAYFVKRVFGREFSPADRVNFRSAKLLLTNYAYNDVVGCIDAVADGLIGRDVKLGNLGGIQYGQPPVIEQWLNWRSELPPVWNSGAITEWERRTGQSYPAETTAEVIPLPARKPTKPCQKL